MPEDVRMMVPAGALEVADTPPPRPLYRGSSGSDPHFVGLRGQRYDVMGSPGFYAILSTPDLLVNAHFEVLPNGFTILDHAGVMLPGTGILLDLTLDEGRPVVLCNHGRVEGYRRIDPGIGPVKGGILVLDRRTVIHAGEWLIEAVVCLDHGTPHPRYGKLDRPHLDLYVHPAGAIPDDEVRYRPHGLLGVSSYGGEPVPEALQGEGVIDHPEGAPGATVDDYRVSHLWARDFRFNLYRW